MKPNEVMQALATAGTEQTRKTYARHGVTGEMFGVSYAFLEKLRKSIKTNQALAEELWATKNHDARILATMIADPALISEQTLTAWAKDSENHVLAGAVGKMAGSTASAPECFKSWSSSKNEMTSVAGWMVLSEIAMAFDKLPDAYFEDQLKVIEQKIHQSMNMTRYSMNSALIAIGCRNPVLQEKALQTAQRIGKVEVDHGDTSCKTPDAAAYILKTAGRKKKQK